MILAAGLGTRLRPLTDDRPKALVEVAGRTMLEIVLSRLRAFGVTEVIVNAHHYAEMMVKYLQDNGNFGMRIEVSREEDLLDTGGGLKKAAWFFVENGGSSEEPFIVHNVDVLSTIDLKHMLRINVEQDALATLAVQDRETSRLLLFDGQGQLCGRRIRHTADSGCGQVELARPASTLQALAFCGIHAVSPRLFARIREEGTFSIIAAYLRLVAEGERISGFRADGSYWRDLGKPENVMQAERDISSGVLT